MLEHAGVFDTILAAEAGADIGPPMPKYSVMLGRLGYDELLSLYIYIDETDTQVPLRWRRSLRGSTGPASRIRAGTAVASYELVSRGGSYLYTKILRKAQSVHRITHFLHTGVWPEVVDHIDQDTRNNVPANLRASTHVRNAQNKCYEVKGYHWHTTSKGYRVIVKGKHVGLFPTPEAARRAYEAAYTREYRHQPSAV